jgi:hypothetical protein
LKRDLQYDITTLHLCEMITHYVFFPNSPQCYPRSWWKSSRIYYRMLWASLPFVVFFICILSILVSSDLFTGNVLPVSTDWQILVSGSAFHHIIHSDLLLHHCISHLLLLLLVILISRFDIAVTFFICTQDWTPCEDSFAAKLFQLLQSNLIHKIGYRWTGSVWRYPPGRVYGNPAIGYCAYQSGSGANGAFIVTPLNNSPCHFSPNANLKLSPVPTHAILPSQPSWLR